MHETHRSLSMKDGLMLSSALITGSALLRSS
jgi:hypothetical protein